MITLTTREVHVATGEIKKVISDRGFGFITAEDGKDYFFHRDSLSGSLDFDRLVGGESVVFDVQQSPKGPRATNVAPPPGPFSIPEEPS